MKVGISKWTGMLTVGLMLAEMAGCDIAASEPPPLAADEPSLPTPKPAVGPTVLATATAPAGVQFEANGPQAGEPTDFALQLDEPEPIAQRIARQTLTIHTRPDADAPLRGRIPMFRAFDVFAHVDGSDCEGDWADVGNGGFVCLDLTREAGDKEPFAEPRMRGYDGLTPFFYARIRKGEPAGRWPSLAAYDRGGEPTARLAAGTDYAFIARKWHRGEIVLIDDRGRVVRDKDVKTFRPSRFEGHDLQAEPMDDGRTIAWTTAWPKATAYAAPSPDAQVTGELDYHAKLDVGIEAFANEAGRWFHLGDGSWVQARDVAVFQPAGSRPSGVLADEVWLDVDLEQQTMTAYEGDAPIFVTLVSSGFKAPTPRGLFRIHHKQAVGDMSSNPGDADFYNVQAVPFVQYFAGGFAIHGAYWHNYFGRPISHGCVNLSPRDAKRIFELTGPTLSDGWAEAYETQEHRGTTVRIRKGDETVQDKR